MTADPEAEPDSSGGGASDTPDRPRQGLPPPITDLIIEIGAFSTYLALVVFVTGWSYGDRWFAELGLNISAIQGIQAETYSGWALWVLEDGGLGLLLVVIVMAFVGGWTVTRTVTAPRFRLIASSALAFAAVAALVVAGHLGASMATRQVPTLFAGDAPAFPRVRVVARTGSTLADFFAARGDLGASTCLRKVFMDQRNLYVYAGYKSLEGRLPNISILPLADIAVIETIRNPSLCQSTPPGHPSQDRPQE